MVGKVISRWMYLLIEDDMKAISVLFAIGLPPIVTVSVVDIGSLMVCMPADLRRLKILF